MTSIGADVRVMYAIQCTMHVPEAQFLTCNFDTSFSLLWNFIKWKSFNFPELYLIRVPFGLSSVYPEPGMSGFPDSLTYVPKERNANPDYLFTVS